MFQRAAEKVADIAPEKVLIHSPMLGGFFGRHFLYEAASPFPQAILLAKAVGRPVKVIWSREEEFLRDALRPMGLVRLRAGLDGQGLPVALEAEAVGEGPRGRWFGRKPDAADLSVTEGIAGKPYAIPNRRIAHVLLLHPTIIGFWRSVGHSMNDFFYETFLTKWPTLGNMILTNCACACWRTSRATRLCSRRWLNFRAAGSAVPSPRPTAANTPAALPWPRRLAARLRQSPRCQ